MVAELENKSNNCIQLGKDEDLLKLEIFDSEGNKTGECLEFNLEDIELPLKYQEILERDKKARAELQNQIIIIEKKQDHKGKKLLSANEEAKIRAYRDFYRKEEEIYDMFLGKDGVKKLLNGKALSWSSLEAIDKIIEEQILPQLKVNATNIMDKIKKKYGDKRTDVIE